MDAKRNRFVWTLFGTSTPFCTSSEAEEEEIPSRFAEIDQRRFCHHEGFGRGNKDFKIRAISKWKFI